MAGDPVLASRPGGVVLIALVCVSLAGWAQGIALPPGRRSLFFPGRSTCADKGFAAVQLCRRNNARVDLDDRDQGDTSRHWQLLAARPGLQRIQSVLRSSSRPACASLVTAPASCASTAITLGAATTDYTAWKIDCRRGNRNCTAHMPARGKCPKRYLGYSTACKSSFLGLFGLDERGAITRFDGLLPERAPAPPRRPPPPVRRPPALKASPPPTRPPPRNPPPPPVPPPPKPEFRPLLPLAFSAPLQSGASSPLVHLATDKEGNPWVAMAETKTGFNPVVLRHNPMMKRWDRVGGSLPGFQARMVRIFLEGEAADYPILACVRAPPQQQIEVWILSGATSGTWVKRAAPFAPDDVDWDVLPALERGTEKPQEMRLLAAFQKKPNNANQTDVAIFGLMPRLDAGGFDTSWYEETTWWSRLRTTQKGPLALYQPLGHDRKQTVAHVALTSTPDKPNCLALWSFEKGESYKWAAQGNWNDPSRLVCGAEGPARVANVAPTLVVSDITPYEGALTQYVAYRGEDGSVRVSMWSGSRNGAGGGWTALGDGPVTRPTTSKDAPGLVLGSKLQWQWQDNGQGKYVRSDILYVSAVVTYVDADGAEVSEGVDVYRYRTHGDQAGRWVQLNTPQQLRARSSASLSSDGYSAPVHVLFDDADNDGKASVWRFA